MPDLSKGTAIIMPTQGFAIQDYEFGKFSFNNGTVSVNVTQVGGASGYAEGTTVGTVTGNAVIFRGSGGTTVAVGTGNPLPVTLQTAIAGEDLTSNVMGVHTKPVASSTYAPSEFTSFGAAAGTGVAIKASAGNVYAVHVTNGGTSLRYFQMFNSATAVANGGTPIASYPLAAASTASPTTLLLDSAHFAPARYMGTGIAIAISSTNGTLGTAAVIAADHNIHLKYV